VVKIEKKKKKKKNSAFFQKNPFFVKTVENVTFVQIWVFDPGTVFSKKLSDMSKVEKKTGQC